MKLYIPTCTLNFNNIFTTESISPALFYAKRGFGNKRYYKVEANAQDNVIMLFSKYPQYHVEDQDLENNPMVIEIDTDDYEEERFQYIQEKDDVRVYASASTIYLNPFNCFVYFKTYADLQAVLTKADQSIENKYCKLYSANFKIRQYKSWSLTGIFSEKDYFDWTSSFSVNTDSISAKSVSNDVYIDRLKGFLICYLIGTNSSVSPEIGRLKQLARKMRNTLSAIVNSPDHKPTDLQDETLLSCIKEFNSIYRSVDANSLFNQQVVNQSLVSQSTGLSKETILSVLRDLKLEDTFYKSLNLKPVYNAQDLYNCMYAVNVSMLESYMQETNRMSDAIKRVEFQQQSNRTKKSLKDLVSLENCSISFNDSNIGKGKFFPVLIESQIKGEYSDFMKGNGVLEPIAVAFVGGAKLKSFIPNEWEGSTFQSYINGLLSNLQNSEAFDLFSIDNEIMQSLAAFCQKGDDIDRLLDYMLQLGFSNYQYALAIYGATRGFASLPKTFTSSIFMPSDYYSRLANSLNQLLFGKELKNTSFPKKDLGSNTESLTTGFASKIVGQIDNIEPKPQKQEKIVKAVISTAELEDAVQSPKAFMYIADNILGTRTKVYKALKESGFEEDKSLYSPDDFKEKIYSIIEGALPTQKSQRKETIDKINQIIDLEAKRQDPEAFIYILDNYIKPTDSVYKKIVKFVLNLSISKNESKPEVENNPPQAPYVPSKLPQIHSFSSLPDNVLRRLEQNWQFTESKYPGDRHEHIKYFVNLCRKEGRGQAVKPSSLTGVFSDELANLVEKELRLYFHAG